jgi:hypothetical protein
MNRHERRAARRAGTITEKLSAMTPEHRKVMDALIDYWIENSEAGRAVAVRLALTTPAARAAIYELADKGLVRFVKGKGSFDGTTPFWVEPVMPMGGWEGSRA